MNFSIDSNIVIGLANTKDRIHLKSVLLMEHRLNDQFFLCDAVLKESQTLFRNSINRIITEIIIKLIPFNQNKDHSKLAFQELLINTFKEMRLTNPRMYNFLELVYDEITIFLKDNGLEMLPSFLSQLSLKYSQQLYRKIENAHPGTINIIQIEHNNLKSIKEKTSGTYFKDSKDERIYFELMTNLPSLVPIVFYTADKEFWKKINQSYSACTKHFGYSESSFSCEIID